MKRYKQFSVLIVAVSMVLGMSACGFGRSESEVGASPAYNETNENTSGSIIEDIVDTSTKDSLFSYPSELEIAQWEEKKDALLSESPIALEQLWNVYTALVDIRYQEFVFKTVLYCESYREEDAPYDYIQNEIDALISEMELYFDKDIVDEWAFDIGLSAVDFFDIVETDEYAVDSSKGKVDVEASWENYFQHRIDMEKLTGIYLTTSNVTLTFPDGVTIVNEGTYSYQGIDFFVSSKETNKPDDEATYDWVTLAPLWVSDNLSAQGHEILNSGSQHIYWGDISGINIQSVSLYDGTVYLVDKLCFVTDGLAYEVRYTISNALADIIASNRTALQVLETLTINGLALDESLQEFDEIAETIGIGSEIILDSTLTTMEKEQMDLDAAFQNKTANLYPYIDDFTGTFYDEANAITLTVCGYNNNIGEITYYLDYQENDFCLKHLPFTWADNIDGTPTLVFYFDRYFTELYTAETKLTIDADGTLLHHTEVYGETVIEDYMYDNTNGEIIEPEYISYGTDGTTYPLVRID